MNRSNRRRKLTVEALESRRTPSVGTFVEDFTNDYNRAMAGYDHHRDGVQISSSPRFNSGARIVPTPPGGPAGNHSLRLVASVAREANYLGWVYHTAESGGLKPWEMVTAASVTVRGGGTVTFTGADAITFVNVAPSDQWVTFRVTENTLGDNGLRLGEVTQFRVATSGVMFVDDVTVEVQAGPLTGQGTEVRVARFGSAMAIYGSARNDLVRVEYLYDDAGTIRVVGLAGTRVTSITPNTSIPPDPPNGAIQISETEVEVPGFAHELGPEERDLLINLRGGDDLLEFVGADFGIDRPSRRIDHINIVTGGGDSIVSLDQVQLWKGLTVVSGPGEDNLAITGRTAIVGFNVQSGAGDDTVQIGYAGARVFDGEPADDLSIEAPDALGPGNPRRTTGIFTGPGSDTVLAAGRLNAFAINLGLGPDRLRIESAIAWRLNVVSGGGADQMEFVESEMRDLWITQDIRDVIRLHRITPIITPAGNGPDPFQLRGRSGVLFELPTSGTRFRLWTGFEYELTRNSGQDEVLSGVFVLGVPERLRPWCAVSFADTDF